MMLQRTAESMFWIGRYTERAENHARLIDALYYMREESSSSHRMWMRIVQTLGEPVHFESIYKNYGEHEVLQYMILDSNHANSIQSCIQLARTNLKAARERMPEELWDILNGIGLWLRNIEADELLLESPFLFLKSVKERLGAFYGAASHTMLRDQLWHIMECGRFLERAENAARFLDSVYQLVLDDNEREQYYLYSAIRSVGGADLFRREHAGKITLENAISLLILNEKFPKSVSFGISKLKEHLEATRMLDGTNMNFDKSIRLVSKSRSALADLQAMELISNSQLHAGLLRSIQAIHEIGNSLSGAFLFTKKEVQL
jgi:uncharacterized alpha-E superfamily protein